MIHACSRRLIDSLALASLAVAALSLPDAVTAQVPAGKPVPSIVDIESALPLPVAGKTKLEVAVLPASEMAPEDKQIAASAEPEIRRRAAIELIALDQPGWTFEQLVCSAFPHSLLLRYSRGEAGKQSMFSAVISRDARQVRIIPIARIGYTLFGSAAASATSTGATNALLAREDPKPPISQIAVCYAALTGAAAERSDDGKSYVRLQGAPTIHVENSRSSEVFFSTAGTPPQSWSMDFGPQGRLLKASRVAASAGQIRNVPPAKELTRGKAVPSTKETPQGRAVPEPQEMPQGKSVPQQNESPSKPVPQSNDSPGKPVPPSLQ